MDELRNDEGEPKATRPSLEQTESDDRPDESDETERPLAGAPVRVAAIDAEHLRNAVAARLFGADADPVKIGRFTVLARLGAGGMGVVYSAFDNQLDRKIALKLLRGVGEDNEAHRARLMREAQALAKLSHPNVVPVFDVGTFRKQVFVAMEFVEGATLREWEPAKDAKDPVGEIVDKFVQAGRGLAAAHEAGLVHRDFKPDNALVGNDGRVRVLDFGLARGIDESEETSERTLDQDPALLESTDSLRQPLTRTGAILGTPAYMAPEQHLGQRADARSDQFAFCVALWEKLYRSRPFQARDIRTLAIAVLDGKLHEPETAELEHTVPQWLRRVLERGLLVDPEERWPDMDTLLAALGSDPRKRRRWLVASIVAGALTIAGGSWALLRDPGPGPCEGGERELVGVWDRGVRDRVHGAFTDTEAPYAENAWKGTAAQLDAYADTWVKMHREVCEASVVRKEESPEITGRKMVCLGQRLTELEQLTELLAEADADVVSRAVVAAGSLGRIETCADERALLAEPIDDERLEELERLLASANGREALGKYDEGLEMAERAVELAQKIGTAHGEGRALLVLGTIQTKRRKVEAAKTNLREALRRADVAGDDATRVEALTQLMRVSFLEHELDDGEALAADARAALDRLGRAPLLEADFYLHYGSLALARGDNQAAGEYHRRALEIREAQLGADHPEVAISLTNIANALTAQGQHDKAEALARRALAIFEAQLGPDHPYTAASHNNIGNSLLEQGRHIGWDEPDRAKPYFQEAAEHYEQAVHIREANLGEDHPSVALNLHNLGEAQRLLGDYEAARATWQRSLDIKREHLGDEHPSTTMTMTGLGRAKLQVGEREQALALLEEAADNRSKRSSSPESEAETLFALAQALLSNPAEDPELTRARAIELATRAQAGYEKAGGDYRGEREEVERWLKLHPQE